MLLLGIEWEVKVEEEGRWKWMDIGIRCNVDGVGSGSNIFIDLQNWRNGKNHSRSSEKQKD